MEQLNLLESKPLSPETKERIASYMVALLEWRSQEREDHVIRGIEEYFMQLQKLLDNNKEPQS